MDIRPVILYMSPTEAELAIQALELLVHCNHGTEHEHARSMQARLAESLDCLGDLTAMI